MAERDIRELYNTAKGSTIFVVGYGGSMIGFSWSTLNDKLVVGVNDVPKIYYPDWHIFSDCNLESRYNKLDYPARTRAVCCQSHAAKAFRAHHAPCIERLHVFVTRDSPTEINSPAIMCRRTVGCSGIELAWKLGAHVIYLLGLDGCSRSPEAYYANGDPSRWHTKNRQNASSEKALVERAKTLGVDPSVAVERVRRLGLYIESRHIDWYEDMIAVKQNLKKHGEVLYPNDGWTRRIVNLSPISIFDQWEIGNAEDVLGDEAKIAV